jgi:hypothetical protein
MVEALAQQAAHDCFAKTRGAAHVLKISLVVSGWRYQG